MQQIIECVPNFSDGRNAAVYNSIADAVRRVRGTHVLDVSPDPDHNRTVITFVGDLAAVEEGAFQAIAAAARQINLDQHSGEHPRIGATDVCPFIPVRGASSADCVALAKRLGERVGAELGVAVYLYGEAATRPERTRLADIRRGEYELWKEEVATNPARLPDYGPALPRPWGATVIGVRPFLVAYNIFLNSDRVDVAEQIARDIRFSGGGLRYVQAKGFLVEGQAQVSMNLTNFEKTPLHRVQELVRREAARYGLAITRAELIGLAPQKALLAAAQWYLQLDGLQEGQILEWKLQKEAAAQVGLHDFIAETAARTPTPGGGSVAALAGALAAALAQMVAGLTAGRKKYAAVAEEARAVLAEAALLQEQLAAAIAEDAAAFEQVMAAWRDKSGTEAARAAAIEQATIGAGEVPLRVARLSRDAAVLATRMAAAGNVNAVSDGAAGAIMAHAAVQAAALNVKINGVGLKDRALAQAWTEEADALVAESAALAETAQRHAAERGGF